MFVGSAYDAVIFGVELEFDEVSHFCLSNIWFESMTALRFIVSRSFVGTEYQTRRCVYHEPLQPPQCE
jgi:hypothetical protein